MDTLNEIKMHIARAAPRLFEKLPSFDLLI